MKRLNITLDAHTDTLLSRLAQRYSTTRSGAIRIAARELARKEIPVIDRQDSKRALVQHTPDGELYVVELASVWEGERVTGAVIVAADGPVARNDLGIDGPVEPSITLFDRLDNWEIVSDDLAEWLQAEENAGRLVYPIGAR